MSAPVSSQAAARLERRSAGDVVVSGGEDPGQVLQQGRSVVPAEDGLDQDRQASFGDGVSAKLARSVRGGIPLARTADVSTAMACRSPTPG